jgi:uncharacterized protein (DUF302 family)
VGVIQIQSFGTLAQTVERLEHAVDERHLTNVAVIHHADAARNAGLVLRPTTLVIFDNPMRGARSMQMSQVAGLSLPIKMLVWQYASKRVWVGYTTSEAFARRYAWAPDSLPIRAMGGALGAIAAEATGNRP